jgi:Carbohydrate esterase, sialic acid-specific acetylesterase
MRGFFSSILRRLLGAGGYIVINPAGYEALQSTLAQTLSHVAALHGEVADARERLAETKGGVSQLQQQLGETLSHMVVLRGEVAEVGTRLAETKSGVSQLQSESGETLSHIVVLRREIAEASGRLAETRRGVSQAQSQLGEILSQVTQSRRQANGSGGGARHDTLRCLPLQLDIAASAHVIADPAGSQPPGESQALAVHYARLASLVSRHWVAGTGPPVDPYPDDDLSLEYALAAIDAGAIDKSPEAPWHPLLPWRQLWADPDCGVFLMLGEANAANHGEACYTPLSDVFSLDFRDMRCHRAQDPLAGASGRGGSIWSRLGDRLIETGAFRRVLFVPLACSDTSIRDWAPEGTMHRRTALALSRLRKELDVSVLPFSAVLWQQGETEANRTQMSAQAYKMHFHDIVADLRANGVFAPVFAACATFCEADAHPCQNRPTIRQALLELPDSEGGIFAGPDTDAIGPEHRSDGCHFSGHGLDRCAELWRDALGPRRQLIEKLETMRAPVTRGRS